jgi:tetratricopeptide (TPR) repeat protein
VKRPAAVSLLVLLVGCVPALREPPPIAVLASKPMPTDTQDPVSLLREADAGWAERPDAAAVREAEALYFKVAQSDEAGVTGLIGAIRAKSWLADHGSEAKERESLAVSAVQTAQWCGKRQPDNPACDYWLAIAVGLQAREVRQTAEDGLKTMIESLTRAIAKDPSYDRAGPERVMALLLVRAPGWPLGPGDPELGLSHARRAVELDPDFPPNRLCLAEALLDTKAKAESRAAYERALTLSQASEAAGDPDAPDWIAEARKALGK